MGFGYLLIGYLITFVLYSFFSALGIGGFALLCGVGIMLLGLGTLCRYHAPFSYAKWILYPMLALAALLIPLAMRWKARLKDVWRTLLYADLYLLCIIPVNILLGTNYGFTMKSPVPGCILDYMGPAPWYYLLLQPLVLALFSLMYLFVRERRVSEQQVLCSSAQ